MAITPEILKLLTLPGGQTATLIQDWIYQLHKAIGQANIDPDVIDRLAIIVTMDEQMHLIKNVGPAQRDLTLRDANELRICGIRVVNTEQLKKSNHRAQE